MRTQQMPRIDLDKLSETLTFDEYALVKGIVSTRGKNKGCLRASKPKVAKKIKVPTKSPRWEGDYSLEYACKADATTGKIAYIWRMVAFFVSPKSQHHCMPCTADFSLPGTVKESHALAKELDQIVDKVVDTIKKSEWHGVRRWGQAYGQIGTPQIAPDGSYIYR